MAILTPEIKQAIDKKIARFETLILAEYGITVKVNYSDNGKLRVITLGELENLVCKVMEAEFPNTYGPMYIRDDSREQNVVAYRQVFFKFADEMGYTLHQIGNFINKTHCTVIFGRNQVKKVLKEEKENKGAKTNRNHWTIVRAHLAVRAKLDDFRTKKVEELKDTI